jgi:pyruvate dehydrogenase (quinone)/pyruvate oxidase
MDGPVVIEAVVDPLEPPQPPKVTREQMQNLAEALVRGQENPVRIGLTIGRNFIDEATFSASSYGFLKRAGKKLGLGKEEKPNEERKDDES